MQNYNKKALIILNPRAGLKKANRLLTDIIREIQKGGYICTSFITTAALDAKNIAAEMGANYDLIVAVGGDGTFNEVVSGIHTSGVKTLIGYIPAGSTNDFATTLKLSSSPKEAAKDIVSGKMRKLDIGSFNDRIFTYVASFGAFTETAYTTPQELKNALGHLAYIIEGSKDIWNIKSYKMKITTDEKTFEGDYIFGAVSNSTSLGGLLKINPNIVDMNDGLLEMLFIKRPENLNELGQIITALNTMNYNSPMIDFCSAPQAEIRAPKSMNWTLDGEMAEGKGVIKIKNIKDAVNIITPSLAVVKGKN
jgi:YegS/Rv2252/BmrU family lipid kinase